MEPLILLVLIALVIILVAKYPSKNQKVTNSKNDFNEFEFSQTSGGAPFYLVHSSNGYRFFSTTSSNQLLSVNDLVALILSSSPPRLDTGSKQIFCKILTKFKYGIFTSFGMRWLRWR